MDPTIFGSDVVDNVDDVAASHINNLRAWNSVFAPLICNMETVSTTDATYTLSDTDKPFQVFAEVGSTDFIIYFPAVSTDNHPFWVVNATTDAANYTMTLKSATSDTLSGYVLSAIDKARIVLPIGTAWYPLPY